MRAIAHYQGEIYTFEVAAGQSVLDAAEAAGLVLPASCHSGVCTTCASKLRSGSVSQPDAMGISPELQEAGYALICISQALSDIEFDADREDEVYELQFGSQSRK